MRRRDERGFALVLALWALLLLSGIGTTVALSARERIWFGGEHAQRAAARWAADAGLASAEAQLAAWAAVVATLPDGGAGGATAALDSARAAERRAWLVALNAPDALLAAQGEGVLPNRSRYRLAARDASGRLNLNAAEEPELRSFFRQWVRDERDLSILVESLLDWRDEDGLERGNGAEAEFYRTRTAGYPVRNGPLQSVGELRLVRGFPARLLDEVEPYLTVLPSRELRINVNSAPARVLVAIPGVTLELAQRLEQRRARRGPLLSAAEITGDPELGALFEAEAGARAIGVIALYPELLEVESVGTSGESGSAHHVRALYALRGGALERVERWELGR